MGEVNAALGALQVGGRNVFQVVASPLCTSTPEVDRVQETVGGSRLCALHGILPWQYIYYKTKQNRKTNRKFFFLNLREYSFYRVHIQLCYDITSLQSFYFLTSWHCQNDES